MGSVRISDVVLSRPRRGGSVRISDVVLSGPRTDHTFPGRIELGEKVTVHAKISPGRAFPVRVTALEPPRRMVWSGGMPLGLFKGERVFAIEPAPEGAVAFSMRESFTGPLAPLISKSIPDLQPAFDEFAACLKARAEAG